jgi:hypothetical protein
MERYWTGIIGFTSFVPAVKMWTICPERLLPKRPKVDGKARSQRAKLALQSEGRKVANDVTTDFRLKYLS